jgi:hypothetical protein
MADRGIVSPMADHSRALETFFSSCQTYSFKDISNQRVSLETLCIPGETILSKL